MADRRRSVVIASTVVTMGPDDSDVAPSSSNMTMEAWAAMHGESPHRAGAAHDECARTRLIGDITRLLHEAGMPEDTRIAGLTLIGWLARRMPGEAPHALGAPRCPPNDKAASTTDPTTSAASRARRTSTGTLGGAAGTAPRAGCFNQPHDRRPGKR